MTHSLARNLGIWAVTVLKFERKNQGGTRKFLENFPDSVKLS